MYINVCGVCVYICMYVVCTYIYISIYVNICICIYMVSLVVLVVKNLSANAGDIRDTGSSILGWEDALEEGIATHSNILVWKIARTEEPGGLQSIRSQRVGHN